MSICNKYIIVPFLYLLEETKTKGHISQLISVGARQKCEPTILILLMSFDAFQSYTRNFHLVKMKVRELLRVFLVNEMYTYLF